MKKSSIFTFILSFFFFTTLHSQAIQQSPKTDFVQAIKDVNPPTPKPIKKTKKEIQEIERKEHIRKIKKMHF